MAQGQEADAMNARVLGRQGDRGERETLDKIDRQIVRTRRD